MSDFGVIDQNVDLRGGGFRPRYVEPDRTNVRSLGLVATDDKEADLSAQMQEALGNGGVLYVPEGKYPIARQIDVELGTGLLDIRLHPNAKIFAVKGFEAGHMFKIFGDKGREAVVRVFGGVFDGSRMPNSTVMPWSMVPPAIPQSCNQPSCPLCKGSDADSTTPCKAATNIFDLRIGFQTVEFFDSFMTTGPHWVGAGGDTHISAANFKNALIRGTKHQGSRDAAIYLANSKFGGGGTTDAVVRNVTVFNAGAGVAIKNRMTRSRIENCHFDNVAAAIAVSPGVGGAESGPEDIQIRNVSIKNYLRGIVFNETTSNTDGSPGPTIKVQNAMISDAGSVNKNGNPIARIDGTNGFETHAMANRYAYLFQSADNVQITGGRVHGIDKRAPAPQGKSAFLFGLRRSQHSDQGCHNNVVAGVTAKGLDKIGDIDSEIGSSNNRFRYMKVSKFADKTRPFSASDPLGNTWHER